MLYIKRYRCISPQQTFSEIALDKLQDAVGHKLKAIEPPYPEIPAGILRRMGKAVRMGVGAALPLLGDPADGIIIGTSNGGMEDSIRFLNQLIEYEEGMLAPGNFVQSTANAIAAQLGMISANRGYNSTHVHRGHAFENALIDASLLLAENPHNQYIVGAVDEISTYNYHIEKLGGWYKKEEIGNKDLYSGETAGTLAGEGASMFLVNKRKSEASAQLNGLSIFHCRSEGEVSARLPEFLENHLAKDKSIDLLLNGENGDSRLLGFYTEVEKVMGDEPTVARFKHMTGEYPTVSGAAVWLGCFFLDGHALPAHMIKRKGVEKKIERILIYNNYKGLQHSFILLSAIS